MKRLNLLIPGSLRTLVVLFACVVLLFTTTQPTFAFGSTKSDPSEGVVQLDIAILSHS
jgi:hypothetical protein